MGWKDYQSVGCRKCHVEQIEIIEQELGDIIKRFQLLTQRASNKGADITWMHTIDFEDTLARLEILHAEMIYTGQ